MRYILSCLLFLSAHNVFCQDTNKENQFIAQPYLQIGRVPSATSLSLVWQVANENANWDVEIKNKSANSWVREQTPVFKSIVAPGVQRRVYTSSLNQLTPGSEFTYRVLKNNEVIFSAEAHAPRSMDQTYRLVIFGDIGAGTPDAKLLARQAFFSKPDMVVIPGDIIYENGLISEYDKRFWPVYNTAALTDSGAPLMRSIPFVAAPGNHDVDNRDLDRFPDGLAYFLFWNQPLNGPPGKEGDAFVPVMKASEANRKAFLDAAGETYPNMVNYSFNYGNAHWLMIDSNPYVDWTDKGLNDWITKDLDAAKDLTWRFVVFHHPGFTSSREHFEQQQMRLLSPVFEKGKVDIVFSGHVHNYQRSFPMTFTPDKKGTLLVGGKDNKVIRGRVVNGKWTLDKSFDGKKNTKPNGVIYIVTGAGGQELYNPEQNNDPDSWQKFTCKFISNTHSLSIIDIKGGTFTLRQVATNGTELDVLKINK